MKPLGIIRPIDDLGRVVVPKEIRRILGIQGGEDMEIFSTNRGVYIQKYDPDDERTPDIFKDNEPAAEPVRPTAKTESRNRVIFHNYTNDGRYYLNLTDDQVTLLDWMVNQGFILSGNYEIVQNMEFIIP